MISIYLLPDIIRKHLLDLLRWGVIVRVLQHIFEPGQRFYSDNIATLNQRVEVGVVNRTLIGFVEQVVLAPHDGGALTTLYGIVVYVVSAIKGIAA